MKFYNLILIAFLVSCQPEKVAIDDNTNEIISILLEKYGKSRVKPPPPNESFDLNQKQIDSIYKQKQKIAIYPVRSGIKGLSSKKEFKTKPYYSLIKGFDSIRNKQIDISLIKNEIGHQLILLDTIKYREDKHYISNNYDRMLHFSPIAFDKKKTKAITVLAYNSGYLNGSTVLLYFEKENGKWHIIETNLLEIS